MEIDETYDSFTLDNGFKVCYKSIEPPFSGFVEGRIRLRHGSMMEEEGEEGLWHFLEHVLFNGDSENYGAEEAKGIKATFPYVNASTSSREMNFPFKVLSEQLPTYLDLISDKLFRHEIDVESINQERNAILMETHDKKGEPFFEEYIEQRKLVYGENVPQTYFVLGEESVVASATQSDLKSIYDRLVHPDNMDIILVGGLPDNLENLINNYFGSVPRGKVEEEKMERNQKIEGQKVQHVAAPFLINKSSPENSNAKVSLTMYGPIFSEDDSVSTILLSSVLNKRLFESIREDKGLAYAIGAEQTCSYLEGLISVGTTVNGKNVFKTLDYIFEEMENLHSSKISEKELKNSKEKLRGDTLIEKPEDYVSLINVYEDYGHSLSQVIDDIDTVTQESVMLAAQKYLPTRDNGDYSILILDPLKKE